MNRQIFIAFLMANMKSAVIPFMKANKDTFGITNVTQSAAKAYINSVRTSDEDVQSLAEACGYTTESSPSTAAPIQVDGLKTVNINVETTTGIQSVPCYMLTVKKWDVTKANSREGKITYTPVLKLDILGMTLSANHELFRNLSVRESIVVGDEIAVRADSVNEIHGTGRNNQPYVTYRGAVLEANITSMGEARMNLNDRSIALAGMSKEAQQIVNGTSATQEAQAFFAKFGK